MTKKSAPQEDSNCGRQVFQIHNESSFVLMCDKQTKGDAFDLLNTDSREAYNFGDVQYKSQSQVEYFLHPHSTGTNVLSIQYCQLRLAKL